MQVFSDSHPLYYFETKFIAWNILYDMSTIGFLVIAFIVFIVVRSRKCSKNMVDFDLVFDQIPVANQIPGADQIPVVDAVPDKEGLNDLQSVAPHRPVQHRDTDVSSQRWSGHASQPEKDNMGRSSYTFVDKLTAPADLHHAIKNVKNAYARNKHKLNNMRYASHPSSETFSNIDHTASNTWEQPNDPYADDFDNLSHEDRLLNEALSNIAQPM
jgi:hypothetical protein